MAVRSFVSAALLLLVDVVVGTSTRLAPGPQRGGLAARSHVCASVAHDGSTSARLRGGLSRVLASLVPTDGAQQPAAQSEAAFARALGLHARFAACECPRLGPPLRRALEIFADAFRLYGADGVLGSFNGGKDAVVIFHLMRAALAHHQQGLADRETSAPGQLPPAPLRAKPQLIYFHDAREFGEVEDFVAAAVADADAQLHTYEGGIVEGLRAHIDAQKAAGRTAAFAFALGTRQGDPNCKGQTAFAPSSAWMPPFMRVNPILDWDYGLVWQFLRTYELPYCALYDRGYTSLGTQDDTLPNPALAIIDPVQPAAGGGAARARFRPAYMLADYSLERAGRMGKASKPPAANNGDADADAARAQPGARRPVERARTAGVVIIGDEILKGQIADTNGQYAMRQLRARGLEVRRIAFVRDDLDEISREVRLQSQQLDLVLTSGGVGPTHDDVTIRALALALDRPIEFNAPMAAMIREARGGAPLSPEQEKMALLPRGVSLRIAPAAADGEPPSSKWPLVQAENVFVLPGVPAFFAAKLDVILAHFVGGGQARAHTRTLVLSVHEEEIVKQLNEAVRANPAVSFGSYPVDEADYKTVVTIEGADELAVQAALGTLTRMMPPDVIVRQPSKNLEHMLQ
ncbi:hypothetical protein KFE25_010541 [Diacronema lutheri]|uniref:FAD synthase n=2 Tax=Diacronema lutheri TaxID=2081491 RepID=A0A8J5XBX5_DIALT|nr:hypothetical protein KFE25_010541 [Diacronema lutheri]